METTALAPYFGPHLTGAEDVQHGKPDPEVFLTAARKIGRDPAHCFVIEDAHVGIAAGRAAGMITIAVTATHSAESFGDHPDLIVNSLEELDLARIRGLFHSE